MRVSMAISVDEGPSIETRPSILMPLGPDILGTTEKRIAFMAIAIAIV